MTIEIPLTRGLVALIDDEDYDRVSQFKWHASLAGKGSNLYYARHNPERNKTIRLHRFILNATAGQVVDHINHDGLDCRRENLRIVSQHQNILNSRKHARSGNRFKGVYITQWKSFRVALTTERGFDHFGHHKDEVFAARVYDAVVTRLRGEFAVTNFSDIDPHADRLAAELIERKGLAA